MSGIDIKQPLELKEAEFVEISYAYKNQTIIVKTYLSQEEQEELLANYLALYFSNMRGNILKAELGILAGIINFCTNIYVIDESGEKPVAVHTINEFLANPQLVNKILDSVKNYGTFRAWVKLAVEEYKEERRLEVSLGKVLDTLAQKAEGFLDSISNLSPESIKESEGLLEKINNSPMLVELLKALTKEK